MSWNTRKCNKKKDYRDPKLWLTISQKRKLREVMEKRGKVPLYPYFHPQVSKLWECILVEWVFALNFNNKSVEKYLKTIGLKLRSTFSEKSKLREVVRKRGKVFLCPCFAPPSFRIVRMLAGWMSFCYNVLAPGVKHGWPVLNLIGAFYIEF